MFQRLGDRSAMQTFIPIAAKRVAAANPIPLAAPVTTATRPACNAGCVLMRAISFC